MTRIATFPSPTLPRSRAAFALSTLAALFWGTNFEATRIVLEGMDPWTAAAMRFVIATAAIMLWLGKDVPNKPIPDGLQRPKPPVCMIPSRQARRRRWRRSALPVCALFSMLSACCLMLDVCAVNVDWMHGRCPHIAHFRPPDFHRHPEMTQTLSGFFPFTVRLLARDGGRSGLCPGVSPPTPPTETRENDGKAICERFGAGRGNRTPDPEITNHVLYQLSYTGAFVGRRRPAPPLRPVLGSAAVIWTGRHARWLR